MIDGDIRGSMWCILRTSGPRTLGLARSLIEAGLDAWTPVHVLSRRRPRSKATVEAEGPILPTFVFVRARHLPFLLAIAASPINPHPAFSVFRYSGKIALVGDRDIESLRDAEQQASLRQRRKQRRVFDPGTRVKLTEGSFAGMSGVVEEGDGKFALVAFGGSMRVKIATFLLEEGALEQTMSFPGVKPEPPHER